MTSSFARRTAARLSTTDHFEDAVLVVAGVSRPVRVRDMSQEDVSDDLFERLSEDRIYRLAADGVSRPTVGDKLAVEGVVLDVVVAERNGPWWIVQVAEAAQERPRARP